MPSFNYIERTEIMYIYPLPGCTEKCNVEAGVCYIMSEETKTHAESEAACQEIDINCHLASFNSEVEYNHLLSMATAR